MKMSLMELFVLAAGLSMDAFAVSVCKGLSLGKIKIKHMCIAGIWFGGFQALMPLAGYLMGSFFADMITSVAHWVAFVLLLVIGGGTITTAKNTSDFNSHSGTDKCNHSNKTDCRNYFYFQKCKRNSNS